MKKFLMRALKLAAVLLAAYVLTYAVNSALGGYWLDIEADGRTYAKEFSVSSDIRWQPRIGYSGWRWSEADLVGLFFGPLAAFDQKYWHPTKDSMSATFDNWLYSDQAISEIHPKLRAKFESNRFINRSVKPPSP